MTVTIHDVAKTSGVAVGTVSRYLNGYKLRENNRLKIEKVIQELGFKQNLIAKSLKRNRSSTIAVLIPNYLSFFFMSIAKMLEQILGEAGYSLLLCDFDYNSDQLENKLQFAKDRFVDGLILFPIYLKKKSIQTVQKFIDESIPVLLLEQTLPGIETDVIKVDNELASFRAVEQLILANHSRIAVVNGREDVQVFRERLEGYKQAMKTYNLPVNENWIISEWFAKDGDYSLIESLFELPDSPTAVFTTHFRGTMGTVMALQKLRLRIPEDVSLIGFDYYDLLDVINPPLSLVEQPIDSIAQAAADIMLKRLKKGVSGHPLTITLNSRMMIRNSIRKLTS